MKNVVSARLDIDDNGRVTDRETGVEYGTVFPRPEPVSTPEGERTVWHAVPVGGGPAMTRWTRDEAAGALATAYAFQYESDEPLLNPLAENGEHDESW